MGRTLFNSYTTSLGDWAEDYIEEWCFVDRSSTISADLPVTSKQGYCY
jgi:hypothetical protein